MRNNPNIDLLAEAYTDQVIGSVPAPGIVLAVEPETERGCSSAMQGCTCGGCPECMDDEVETGAPAPEVVQDCIVKLEDLLQSLQRLYGCDSEKSQFNLGYEDGEVDGYEDGE